MLNSNLFKIVGLFIVAVFLLRFCWGAGYKSNKYIITVNVKANGKTYSGSSVQFQSTTTSPEWISNILLPETKCKGEAVVVNVDGKYLFLLFNYSVNKNQNYQRGWKPWYLADIWKHGTNMDGGYAEYRYPFVTFTDVNDPLTVKQVTEENFEQYFGKGAKITSIEVQRTFKPVTYGQVEKVIPWIRDGMRGSNGERKKPVFASDVKNYNIESYYSNLSVAFFILE